MDVAMYERALARTGKVVAGTRPEQFGDPTPCRDWDVRALLDHLIGGIAAYAAGGSGRPQSPEGTDHVGDDHVTSFHAAESRALSAFKASGALEKTFEMPWGEMKGAAALGLAIAEAAVHGWDLAKATHQEAEIDDDIARAVYGMTASMMAPLGDYPRGGSFGDPVDIPDDAPPTHKAVAYLGRRP